MKNYYRRIASVLFVVIVMAIWNTMYYWIMDYEVNWLMDIAFSLSVLLIVWYFSSFFDKWNKLIEQLKLSETKYRLLSENSTAVINNLEQAVFKTDEKGNITFLNPAWTTLTGWGNEESLGKCIFTFLDHPELASMKDHVEALFKNKAPSIKKDLRIRKKDGNYCWAELFVKFSYSDKGEFIESIGTLFDISLHKNSERELREMNESLVIQSERLAVVAQLAAGIAHEIRNPLTSVKGFMQLLNKEVTHRDEYFNVISSEINRIELVSSELLILAKPQSVNYKMANIVTIMDHIVLLLETNANLHNVELVKSYRPSVIEVLCDNNQIKQVFLNIIKNGIESMDQGGKITITITSEVDQVIITIEDEGCGISKERLSKIGEPFFTTKTQGTGLGLTVCYRIVHDHKGSIHVSSKMNEGTKFEIRLPVVSELRSSGGKIHHDKVSPINSSFENTFML